MNGEEDSVHFSRRRKSLQSGHYFSSNRANRFCLCTVDFLISESYCLTFTIQIVVRHCQNTMQSKNKFASLEASNYKTSAENKGKEEKKHDAENLL